jgi:glycosyltransferase involved in cell wall biosynthesis
LTKHDVAIYSPFAASYYERGAAQGGGAEIQMTVLARELAKRGRRTAHIVFPVADPVELPAPAPTVYQREPYHGAEGRLGRLREAAAVYRSLSAVDAAVYVIRGHSVNVAAVAEYCRLHERGMIFSAANDFDLVPRSFDGQGERRHKIYIWGLRKAGAVVVQSAHQLELAAQVTRPEQRRVFIPSFSEEVPASTAEPESFIWISRVIEHKQPLAYLALARALPEARFTMIATDGIDNDPVITERVHRESAEIDNLEVLGPQRREDVLERIGRATAIVSTSKWEGMPNVFLEAWARGVPALTLEFDPDGLITARGLGRAAEGSPERFAEYAEALWVDRALRAELGAAARRYIRERHFPGAVSAAWEAVIDQVRR